MLKPNCFIVLALLLALGLAGSVVAGPREPHWGDPDIVEGIKAREKVPQEQVSSSLRTCVVFDIPFLGRIVLVRQEQREKLSRMAERLPAAKRTKPIRK